MRRRSIRIYDAHAQTLNPGQEFGDAERKTSLHPVFVIKAIAEAGVRQIRRCCAKPHDRRLRDLRLPQHLATCIAKSPQV
jgi:hypothetical protein